MKAYRMVCIFLDFDEVGPMEAKRLVESARLPNHIAPPGVLSLEESDIGEWTDAHPLNRWSTKDAAIKVLEWKPVVTGGA